MKKTDSKRTTYGCHIVLKCCSSCSGEMAASVNFVDEEVSKEVVKAPVDEESSHV